ncbi:hypothetical protein L6R52_32140 [Myxococcota bacterium]|nr:hypothetical protein [Myxococcota bacterium]
MDEVMIKQLVRFTLRWSWLLVLTALGGVGAGAAIGLSRPAQYSMRAVVGTATVAMLPEGHVEDLGVVGSLVVDRIDAAIDANELPAGTSITPRAILGQPPKLEVTPLVELVATGPTQVSVERAIELAAKTIIDAQTPLYEAERARLERHVEAIRAELARLDAEPVNGVRHTLYTKAVRELTETTRQLSPARLAAPRVLRRDAPRAIEHTSAVALPIAIGGAAGLVAGYVIALFTAALLVLRRRARSGGASPAHG